MSEWKDIPGYEDHYQICHEGLVVSCKSGNRQSRIIKTKICRYEFIMLSKEGIAKTHSIHRLMGLTFLPNPDNLPQIDHIDNNKTNNHITNLRWVSRSENLQARPISIMAREREKKVIETRQARCTYSGETSIRKLKNGRYAVDTRINRIRHYKVFDTIEEAIIHRDAYFAENKVKRIYT